jgi:hypothetical protein
LRNTRRLRVHGQRNHNLEQVQLTVCGNAAGPNPANRALGCKDVATSLALLQGYACRKFSESDCSLMDRNEWDESMATCLPSVCVGGSNSQAKEILNF